MDAITTLGSIGSAFGLSASAGLNAYIPLLMVALVAKFTDFINLSETYDVLASWPVIIVLTVLLVIEVFVDKIPAVDTLNDMIQTFIRPAAGALMFAANANVINDISPVFAIIAGIFLAGSVHVTKGAVRPVVTASTAGTGNWLVSIIEDIVAFFVSLLAIFIPFFMAIAMLFVIAFIVRFWWRKRSRRPVHY